MENVTEIEFCEYISRYMCSYCNSAEVLISCEKHEIKIQITSLNKKHTIILPEEQSNINGFYSKKQDLPEPIITYNKTVIQTILNQVLETIIN